MNDTLIDVAIATIERLIPHLEAEFERTDDGGYYQDMEDAREALKALKEARATAPIVLVRGRIPHVGYSVSYRNRWWKRRRYAAGNLPEAEAVESFENLVRAGFKRVRMEATR